jgi:zinc protease
MSPARLARALLGGLVLAAIVFAPAVEAKKRSKRKGGAPEGSVVTLDDGVRLVHVPLIGSGTISLRFIVQGGGAHDPQDKTGLAHLLEHLVFHGTYHTEEGELFDDARAIGADINAWTSPEWTTYVLDGPTDTFVPLASKYLKTITSPALHWTKLEREKAVVLAEQELRNARTILWATDQLVFPSDNRGRNVIGSEKTRAGITNEDLVQFYARHYRTRNIIAVVVGDIVLDDAKALLTSSVLLPPQVAAPNHPPPAPPNLGSEAKTLAWTTATAVGYAVDEKADDATCQAAARLVDYHVVKAVRLDDTVAQQSEVFCHRTRGHRFLVAVAFGTNALASQLPDLMDKAFKEATRPTDVKLVLAPPTPNAKKIQKLLTRTVKPERRFLVHMSPFEG